MIKKVEVAVKGILLNSKNEVLVLQRNREDDYAGKEYDLPGGRLELGEKPVEGLKREIIEETGLSNIGKVVPIKTWSFNKNDTQIVGITFLVFLEKGENNIKLSFEHEDFKWITENDINKDFLPDWLKNELKIAFNFLK